MRSATVQMPGTCGELVQGTLSGTPFHVTCPIDVYSTVRVSLGPDYSRLSHEPGFEKAATALRILLAKYGQTQLGGSIEVKSGLPRAKGMASSTADVAGAVLAGALALGIPVTEKEVAEIALAVEPTDGSLFPHIVLFDHREGKLFRTLGTCPPIDVLVIDTGGEIDTVAFNAVDRKETLLSLEPEVVEALRLVEIGLETNREDLIGRGATLSALANQRILYKPQLETVLDLTMKLGGLGVCVGHSGTVIGALWRQGERDGQELVEDFTQSVPGIEVVTFCRMVDGGARMFVGDRR